MILVPVVWVLWGAAAWLLDAKARRQFRLTQKRKDVEALEHKVRLFAGNAPLERVTMLEHLDTCSSCQYLKWVGQGKEGRKPWRTEE